MLKLKNITKEYPAGDGKVETLRGASLTFRQSEFVSILAPSGYSYCNHSVGFVFQSYNLIPHQTILQNVELALTLSGVSKQERKNGQVCA